MSTLSVVNLVRSRPDLKVRLKKALTAIGYDTTDWVRVVMYQKCFEFIGGLGPQNLDAMEISAGPQWSREFTFRSFTGTHYPAFDICTQTLPQKFDLIIADQIFEHLKWPYRAARNVHAMLKPNGYFLIATPFLIRVHKSPIDCSRWTEEGLFFFLQECGFEPESIKTDSWGNRACLKANLNGWPKRGFAKSLVNEPDFPVMVWAFAQKTSKSAAA
jgi:SAM-dependent methyltransferase